MSVDEVEALEAKAAKAKNPNSPSARSLRVRAASMRDFDGNIITHDTKLIPFYYDFQKDSSEKGI